MRRNPEELQKKLSAYLPEGDRILELKQLTTGHSNETYIVEGLNAILRLPPPTAPLLEAHGIITQAKIYQEVGALEDGPPVPRILHICESPDILGDPFFLMERVSGQCVDDYVLPEWFVSLSDEQRGTMCESWSEAVGSIARVPPIPTLGEPVTPEQELRRWQGIAANNDCPELVDVIAQLLQIPAPRSGPPSVVQGDCKISNMLFENQQVSAVLDWELAYNGEPLADLGYLLYGFANEYHGCSRTVAPSGMWNREQIIGGWEKGSGRSAAGLIWYEAAEVAKLAGIYAKAKQLFNTGASDDQRMLMFIKKLDESIAIINAMLPCVERTCH